MKHFTTYLSVGLLIFSCTNETFMNDNTPQPSIIISQKEKDTSLNINMQESTDSSFIAATLMINPDIEIKSDFLYSDSLNAVVWNRFRNQLITKSVDFDWSEYGIARFRVYQEIAQNLVEDTYTRQVLQETDYEHLEDGEFNGTPTKMFHVVAMSGNGILSGYSYHFVFGINAMELVAKSNFNPD